MANTFKIGDLDVIVVSDGTAKAPATMYFAGTTAEQWEPHKRWLDHEGNVNFPFSCFLIRSGNTRVLIDTGLGPITLFQFRGGALLGELAAAGFRPEDIDAVFVTHLHVDHCGTCIQESEGEAHSTFPNAVYRWTAQETNTGNLRPRRPARTSPSSPCSRQSARGSKPLTTEPSSHPALPSWPRPGTPRDTPLSFCRQGKTAPSF